MGTTSDNRTTGGSGPPASRHRFQTIHLRYEQDAVLARQRGREAAAALGFREAEQVKLATAISELARNALQYAGGGEIELALGEVQGRNGFWVVVTDDGPGIPNLGEILSGAYRSRTGMGLGLRGVSRMADAFDCVSRPEGGLTVSFGVHLPAGAPAATAEAAAKLAARLEAQQPSDSYQEFQRQNQDLMKALAELQRHQEELREANRRLAETNAALRRETDRREAAEGGLSASQARYRTLVENLPQRIFLKDTDLRFLSGNTAFLKDLGIEPEELPGKSDHDFFPAEMAEKFQADDRRVLETGETLEVEEENLQSGERCWVQTVKTRVLGADGEPMGVLGIYWDVTEQRRAREELKAMAREWAQTFDAVNDSIWLLDADQRIVRVNAATCRTLGRSSEKLVGQHCCEVVHHQCAPIKECPFLVMRRSGKRETVETSQDGRTFQISVDPIRDGDGEITGAVHIMRDITERVRAEEMLRLQVERMPVGCVVWTEDFKVATWNPAAEAIFGFQADEVMGKSPYGLIVPDSAREHVEAIWKRLLEGDETAHSENRNLTKDGREIVCHWINTPLHTSGQVSGVLSMVEDVTERQEQEARLRQQQKLDSVAILAAGVAHEINNPITGVMNYADIIRDLAPEDSEIREFAGEIITETERVAKITSKLLTFARHERSTEGSMSRPQELIDGAIALIETVVKKDRVILEVDVPDDLPSVKCRTQQIQQVLFQLMLNSRDALNEKYPEHDPGKILGVGARRIEVNGKPWLRITVEDHGTGIPPDVVDRIYEPFFTTRNRTKGTGMGLAIARSMVEEHHGRLRVETEPGEFTRFHVDLPATDETE